MTASTCISRGGHGNRIHCVVFPIKLQQEARLVGLEIFVMYDIDLIVRLVSCWC